MIRENPCAEGRPYTYLRTTGLGHIEGWAWTSPS